MYLIPRLSTELLVNNNKPRTSSSFVGELNRPITDMHDLFGSYFGMIFQFVMYPVDHPISIFCKLCILTKKYYIPLNVKETFTAYCMETSIRYRSDALSIWNNCCLSTYEDNLVHWCYQNLWGCYLFIYANSGYHWFNSHLFIQTHYDTLKRFKYTVQLEEDGLIHTGYMIDRMYPSSISMVGFTNAMDYFTRDALNICKRTFEHNVNDLDYDESTNEFNRNHTNGLVNGVNFVLPWFECNSSGLPQLKMPLELCKFTY